MFWEACRRMDEGVRLAACLPGGWKMAVACREFCICRKTGYKVFYRYRGFGLR